MRKLCLSTKFPKQVILRSVANIRNTELLNNWHICFLSNIVDFYRDEASGGKGELNYIVLFLRHIFVLIIYLML